MKNKIKKIQIAFDEPVYEEDLNLKGIFKISKSEGYLQLLLMSMTMNL